MTYVHGHARDDGWVVGHVRRPNRPEGGQLPLLDAEVAEAHDGVDGDVGGEAEPVVPAPRRSPEGYTGCTAKPPARARAR